MMKVRANWNLNYDGTIRSIGEMFDIDKETFDKFSETDAGVLTVIEDKASNKTKEVKEKEVIKDE